MMEHNLRFSFYLWARGFSPVPDSNKSFSF